MIPKILHYIWFGDKKMPAQLVEYVDGWKRLMPDYEIREWNNGNFDTTLNPWMDRMFRERRFGFVGDYTRLYLMKHYGGIYLDTDVEVKKRFDPFLQHGAFFGFEYDCYLATCLMGSRPGHPLFDELLAEYDHLEGPVISNSVVTKFFLKRFPEFRLNNKNQVLGDDVHIFSKEYLSVPAFDRDKNFSRHHGSNLWREEKKITPSLKKLVRRLMGEPLYYKFVAYKVCRDNVEFSEICRLHKKLGA